MIDFPILPILTELGLKPAEVLILGRLWQNVRGTKHLLNKLVQRVVELETKHNCG